jgi:hypothetical protein
MEWAVSICYYAHTMTKFRPIGAKKIADLGQQIYDERLRKKLERRYKGKIVAIEVESGDYFVGDTIHEATEKGRQKYPDSVFYSVRVGYPAVYSFTPRLPISANNL